MQHVPHFARAEGVGHRGFRGAGVKRPFEKATHMQRGRNSERERERGREVGERERRRGRRSREGEGGRGGEKQTERHRGGVGE